MFAKVAAKKKVLNVQPHTDFESKFEIERAQFFNNEVLDTEDDPLEWWRENEGKYPLLKNAAKLFLAIPATETASERVFSSAGNVVSSRRERLLACHVEELVFLHQNAKLFFTH